MKIKARIFSLLLSHSLFLIPLLFSGCGNGKSKLEGKWRATGNSDSTHVWFLDYTFSGGNFIKDGYPPLHEEGKFKILREKNDSVIVELTPEKDSSLSPYETFFLLSKDGNSFRIATTVFLKVNEEKK